MKIVVLGASGFVGTTLVERLLRKADVEVVPVIHSAGSAWRLARRGSDLAQIDVADRAALKRVLHGATHVVNCTRGPRAVMIKGLEHILETCLTEGVQRFVHLSSVMVYGDPPHPRSEQEDAPTSPEPGFESYAMIKHEQDRLVQSAAANGLPSVVLCPPNISGPFSGYVVGILNGLREGSFALVDDGESPCNLVDVRNLCHAIELALEVDGAVLDGRRIFVTDGGEVCWRDVVAELLELANGKMPQQIDRAELMRRAGRGVTKRRHSVAASLRHLVSSDVRAALRKDPLLARLDQAARRGVARLGRKAETKLRISIEGHAKVVRPDPYESLNVGLCAQQLRGVRHLIDRAARELGYRPQIGFSQSMADFRAWYRAMHGVDGRFWDISCYLYG